MIDVFTKYLLATYKDGARGENNNHDCWSLVRSARVDLYGKPLLASRGGEYRYNPRGLTERYREQISEMREISEPVPGAVVAVLHKKHICQHAALIVHDVNKTGLGLHVLEITSGGGARLCPLYQFHQENSAKTVKYYDD